MQFSRTQHQRCLVQSTGHRYAVITHDKWIITDGQSQQVGLVTEYSSFSSW